MFMETEYLNLLISNFSAEFDVCQCYLLEGGDPGSD